MSFLALVSLAIGLAMDATAVAAARGLAAPAVRPKHVLLVASLFGGAQAIMPMLGWLVGDLLGPLVTAWDHWIAFLILVGVGGKMLWEAREPSEGDPARKGNVFGIRVMLVLALATSIDAFAVGITLPMLGAPLALSVLTIGVITGALSAAGVVVGRRFGGRFGRRLDVFGGLVLVGLGLKILVEHLSEG